MKALHSPKTSRLRGFWSGLAVGVALTGLAVAFAPIARQRFVELLKSDAEEVARLRQASTRLRARLESEADCKCFGLLIPNGVQWRYVNNVTNANVSVTDDSIKLDKTKLGTVAVIAAAVVEPK